MKPEDEKKVMELLERELAKRLEGRYGQPPSAKADESTQARRSGPKGSAAQRQPDQVASESVKRSLPSWHKEAAATAILYCVFTTYAKPAGATVRAVSRRLARLAEWCASVLVEVA
jgi:hypothetical protein